MSEKKEWNVNELHFIITEWRNYMKFKLWMRENVNEEWQKRKWMIEWMYDINWK